MSDTPLVGTATACPRCQTSLTVLRRNRWCGGGSARVAVLVLSAGLLAGVLAMFAGGALLIVIDFPGVRIVPGVLLALFAFALRPRFGRVDPLYARARREIGALG